MKTLLPALLLAALVGAAAGCGRSEEVRKIRAWEASLKAELAWPIPGRKKLEDAVLEVSADPLPPLGDGAHFHGVVSVEADGYEKFLGDISDSHSNVQNAGVMDWYKTIRSGTYRIHYRYTFTRSFTPGPDWQDRFKDWVVLHSGVKTITLKKLPT